MTLLRHRHGGSELIGLNTLLAFDLGGVLVRADASPLTVSDHTDVCRSTGSNSVAA